MASVSQGVNLLRQQEITAVIGDKDSVLLGLKEIDPQIEFGVRLVGESDVVLSVRTRKPEEIATAMRGARYSKLHAYDPHVYEDHGKAVINPKPPLRVRETATAKQAANH